MLDAWKKIANRPLRICNWIPYIIVAGITIFLIAYRDYIPEQVPQHWNAAGEIDRYTTARVHIVLIVFMYMILLFHALMAFVMPMFLNSANYFKKEVAELASEEHRIEGMRATLYMLFGCDILTELMFAYIVVCGIRVQTLGGWFVPAVFIALGALFIGFFWKINRIEKAICQD